jgi:hypothetical protein
MSFTETFNWRLITILVVIGLLLVPLGVAALTASSPTASGLIAFEPVERPTPVDPDLPGGGGGATTNGYAWGG